MKNTRLIATIAFGFLAACEKPPQTPPPADSAASADGEKLLDTVFDTPPAGDARAIADVKATAKPGDEVTLTGRIMGNKKPFVEGRAAFILADPSILTACSDVPDDECETPWDACCDSPEDKRKAIVTIQIAGPDGRVIKQPLEGIRGLANLATVTATGTVAEGSGGDVLILNATAIRPGSQ